MRWSVCHMELDAIKASTMASTIEPTKEVLTTFYPPKHPTKWTVQLVGIQVDPNAKMKDHIATVLSNTRIAMARIECT